MTWRPVSDAIDRAYSAVRDRGVRVEPTRWQSVDVSKRLEATTYEVLNHTLQFQVPGEGLDDLRGAVRPSLPWADDHFAERVGGKPLNPGIEWAHWPWGLSADRFRTSRVMAGLANPHPDADEDGVVDGFSHSYMERMWPKLANRRVVEFGGALVAQDGPHVGIRFGYGDASDVVDHLLKHPDSRQAYLPIWFPEDTGKTDVRVPCTLGYHLIHRRGFLHCTYYIRSCDLYRHLRDDVYLTVRLQLWMLDQLRARQPSSAHDAGGFDWGEVRPGLFTMHVVSLHCFVNDCSKLWPDWRPR